MSASTDEDLMPEESSVADKADELWTEMKPLLTSLGSAVAFLVTAVLLALGVALVVLFFAVIGAGIGMIVGLFGVLLTNLLMGSSLDPAPYVALGGVLSLLWMAYSE